MKLSLQCAAACCLAAAAAAATSLRAQPPRLANGNIVDALKRSGALEKFPKAPVVDVATVAAGVPAHEGTQYRPTVLMHGLGDAGSNPGMQSLAATISKAYPGAYATAVDVADGLLSFITPMWQQVAEFAQVVRADSKLANGFNAVGLSQGGLIVRAYIELYNDPPVYNFVSVCGVQGGEFACPLEMDIIPFLCEAFSANPYEFLFNDTTYLTFADYWVDSMNQTKYLSQNPWLPVINNELPGRANSTYKARFSSLNALVLSAALNDTVVYPWQSEQFGGYAWGTSNQVFTLLQSAQYTQNYLGLADLYAAGRVNLTEFEGDHLRFSDQYWNTVILPYLGNTMQAAA